MYRGGVGHGSAARGMRIENCPEDMLSPIRSECTETAGFSSLSAHANGLRPLLVLASRHHRVPVLRDDPKPLGLAPATTTGNWAGRPDPKLLIQIRHLRSYPLKPCWTPHRCPLPIAQSRHITPNGEGGPRRRLTSVRGFRAMCAASGQQVVVQDFEAGSARRRESSASIWREVQEFRPARARDFGSFVEPGAVC